MAATHRDLNALIQEGTFRADLFYRLDVVPIWLPPLRDRGQDIPLLAESFCKSLGAANDVPDAHLSPDALNRLTQYPWPGNVRELQNLIERLIVLSDAPQIRLADVERELSTRSVAPGELQAQRGDSSLASLKRKTERAALEETLKRCDNNRTQAARILGVSRRTLYNKLEEYGIS